MLKPPIPENEAERLATLRNLDLLDTPAEQRFNRITRTAAHIFKVPIVLVSLVDSSRQWFKSRYGLTTTETSREESFCAHAILGDTIFLVEDALADARFADNPLVTGAPHVRFYAGQPLNGPDGLKVGTLCLIDRQPRKFDGHDRLLLGDLAQWVERELILDREQAAWRSRLAGVMHAVDNGVLVVDAKGRIETLNAAAVPLFGHDEHEIVGQNIEMLLPGVIAANQGSLIGTVEQVAPVREFECRLLKRDGSASSATVRASVFYSRGQRMFAFALPPRP